MCKISALARISLITSFLIIGVVLTRVSYAQQGYLNVSYTNPGLTVVLNDSLIGYTPLSIIAVDTGAYLLSVENPRRGSWKFNDWSQKIIISQNQTTTVNPNFEIPLTIRTEPFDAQVFLNDSFLGNTPLHYTFDENTSGSLHVKKELYFPYTLNFKDLQSNFLNIDLEPDREQQKIYFQIQNRIERNHRMNKRLTYSLMTITLCSGFMTAYFKDKADNKYERYLTAGSIGEMNRLYDDSKRLDNYSNISLGIFEVSFTLSFYFLFKTVVD